MSGGRRMRVLVVDDSLVVREMLTQILASDPGIEVVGAAKDGREAVDMVASLKPDLVTMDIHMPDMDGLEATERIMAFHPTPILVVSSSVHGEGIGAAFEALAAGALEVVKKPEPADWADMERIGTEIIRKAKLLSRVRVITHVRGRHRAGARRDVTGGAPVSRDGKSLVAIGSSTGGPSALQKVLEPLPADLPVPVVVAQHIADGFVPGLVAWLDGQCAVHVKVAERKETMRPGVVYVSPTGGNVEVDSNAVRVRDPLPGQLYVPSADTLFTSVARAHRSAAVGVILTGMGNDGARGLKAMLDAGCATIAQDEVTCVVFGMPKAAIDLHAAQQVLPVELIGEALVGLVTGRC
jgi:two-component system chemotaxis response regulator CheB